MKRELLQKFEEKFGTEGEYEVYFAPGRVNLIGEHTDYNGGHVFPCALTIGTYAVARKRTDKKLRFYSMNFEKLGIIESSIENLEKKAQDDWANYPKGVVWTMQQKGYEIECGLDVLYFGNIPNGSGLSSSASLEVLTGYILNQLFRLEISFTDLAVLGQYAENKFIGVNCGIMDQFAIAMGKKDNAIFLDTADLSYEYAPLDLGGAKIIIMNTNKKRGLGDSKYNERRSECEAALADLQKVVAIKTLGDLSEEQFEAYKAAIQDPVQVTRARHA
ncbi:MAG: galK, partial [Herbinix sp.]|nr:galK [Herbinix sp.]